jgi:hypothetical protein
MILSNELASSDFYTYKELGIINSSSPFIRDWLVVNSENIIIDIASMAGTPPVINPTALTVIPLPKDYEINGIHLNSVLLVQLTRTQESVLAETWLEGLYEYGVGQDDTNAIADLFASLGEYLSVLKVKTGQLGESARRELDTLLKLIEPMNQNPAHGV